MWLNCKATHEKKKEKKKCQEKLDDQDKFWYNKNTPCKDMEK